MRVMTWNCHRAAAASPVWQYLLTVEPDIALLQEVSALPASVEERYACRAAHPVSRIGGRQRFQTIVLTKGELGDPIVLSSPEAWIKDELNRFAGNLVSCGIALRGELLNVVSVYSPAWAVERIRLNGIDTSGVQLAQNRDLWLSDLLLTGLQAAEQTNVPWIVGGDFNMSETFDEWSGGPRGNKEYLERMHAFGLIECLRLSAGALTPTFKNARGGKIVHQMDHLFVSGNLSERLVGCRVGAAEDVFDGRLSDHLPIIADFNAGSHAGRTV
jgi:exonuclease III